MKMTQADFEYFKKYGLRMQSKHEKDYAQVLNSKRILKYYEGVRSIDTERLLQDEAETPSRINLNKFFPATNTVVHEFYPANPLFIVTPKQQRNKEAEIKAKVLASALNYYFDEKRAKHENQNAIIDAWFFGYGVMKQGWIANFKAPDNAQSVNQQQQPAQAGSLIGTIAEKTKAFFTGRQSEKSFAGDSADKTDELDYESGPFFLSVSPLDIYLDDKKPFSQGKVLTHRLTKTLAQIKSSPLYKGYATQEFVDNFTSKSDDRDIEMNLYEMWIYQKDGIYIFTYVDGWPKPLRWEKWGSIEEEIPFSLLRLNDEPLVTYPVSNLQVAMRVQREIDYIMSMWFENLSKFRSMTYINGKLFSNPSQARLTLEMNPIGALLIGDRPATSGDLMNLASTPMPNDAFGMLSVLQTNLQEILTVTGAKMSGQSELDTATQEKIAEMGNQTRTAGMKDKIKEFIIDQARKLTQQIQQFDTVPKILKVTGINLQDPETQQYISDEWVKFGNGEKDLKDVVQGEYDFDIDFTQVMSKDLPVIRKQMAELAQIASNLEPLFQRQGKTFDAVEFFKDMTRNFETISNPEKYIKDVHPQGQVLPGPGLVGMPQAPGSQGLSPLPEGIPTPEAIGQSAQEIPI